MTYLDPLGLFVTPQVNKLDNHYLKDLSEKNVQISLKTEEGHFVPEGGKIVWPVLCR